MTAGNPVASLVPAPQYNNVFERLVLATDQDSADRLVSLVAYGLYKQKKQAWCVAFYATHGRQPDAQEMRNYLLQYTDPELAALEQSSLNELVMFAQAMNEDEIKEAEERGRHSEIANLVRKQSNPWIQVLLNVAASFIFSVMVFVIAALVASSNPESRFAKAFQVITNPSAEDYKPNR